MPIILQRTVQFKTGRGEKGGVGGGGGLNGEEAYYKYGIKKLNDHSYMT